MAATNYVTSNVDLIKYYLDEYEQKDPKRYTADYTRPGPAILALVTLYNTLRRTYVYFRLHVSKDVEGSNKDERLVPVGTILLHFFTKRVYANKRDFEVRYPRLTQMISIASEVAPPGPTMASLKSTV